MKAYKRLYQKLCSLENLYLAYKKARKGKTNKNYVIEFEKNLENNLKKLQQELIKKLEGWFAYAEYGNSYNLRRILLED